MRRSLPAVLVLAVVLCFGAAQIATVTSQSSFQLRGAQVTPGQGVPSWPVAAGDSIVAGASPVSLTFPDGSTITLTPGSRATVSMSGGMPVFNLQDGTAQYALRSALSVRLEARSKQVTPETPAGRAEPAGVYSIGDRDRGGAAPFWTSGRKSLLVLGLAAAGGTIVGLAVAGDGDNQLANDTNQ